MNKYSKEEASHLGRIALECTGEVATQSPISVTLKKMAINNGKDTMMSTIIHLIVCHFMRWTNFVFFI